MKLILFFIILTNALPVMAFDYRRHTEMTLDSIQVLLNCGYKLNQVDFAKGSADEDTTQYELRAYNWHFYNQYKNLRQGPIFFESVDFIFKYRHDELQNDVVSVNQLGSKDYRLGRILHYIQDMLVPSHIVPVFHGKPFGKIDPIDKMVIPVTERNQIIKTIDCQDLKNELRYLKERHIKNRYLGNLWILDKAADRTIKKIKQNISGTSVSWDYFWKEPLLKVKSFFDLLSVFVVLDKPAKRFGTYRGLWGAESQVQDPVTSVKYQLNDQVYHQFYQQIYKDSLFYSSVFLIFNSWSYLIDQTN